MRWQAKRGVLLGSVFAYAKNNYDMQGIVPHTPLDISRAGAPYLLAKEVSRAISNKIHEKAVRQ